MALTNKTYDPYEFREFPKEVQGKIVYSAEEEAKLLGAEDNDDNEGTEEEREHTKEELQTQADELGVKYRPTWGIGRLRQAIKEAKE